MKVLSLLQPWATLFVMGAKQIETRSWNTQYRGPLLIHASKSHLAAKQRQDKAFFKDHFHHYTELPYGAIIGQVNIIETVATENIIHYVTNFHSSLTCLSGSAVSDWKTEMAFGDYSANRWGWLAKDFKKFKNPIPCSGQLSIWDTNKLSDDIKLLIDKELTV